MADDTPTAIHYLVRRAFATLQAKDLETLMQLFAEFATSTVITSGSLLREGPAFDNLLAILFC